MNKFLKTVLCTSLITAAGAAAYGAKAKSQYNNTAENPDYLLILGCRVRGNEPEEMLMMRIKDAALFLEKYPNTIAIACGGIVHDDQYVSEAQAIKEGLVAFGIDESRIILEDKSQTTFQNFVNAKKIIEERENGKNPEIAFLTSNFHVLRASKICKSVGLDALSVAADSPEEFEKVNLLREFLVLPLTYAEKFKERGE